MIGHASTLINFYGTMIITDPVLVASLPFPKRIVKPGFLAKDLPPIDIVLISHAHLDHLNIPSLRLLAKKSKLIIVPKNCADLVSKLGFPHVSELNWGETKVVGSVSVSAFKPRHWGQRVPWEGVKRHYNSYIVENNKTKRSVFFCGDSGYDKYFKNIGQKYNIDLALLPIGAYSPSLFRRIHMDPLDALAALIDLRAKAMVPIHWGSFRLSLEPLDEPPKILSVYSQKFGLVDKVHILNNGESYSVNSHPKKQSNNYN